MGGYKVWSTNEAMSAVDLNGYISEQLIPYFATNTARDVAIPSPHDGQLAYTASFGELYRWQAFSNSWVSVLPRVFWKDSDNARTTTTYFNDPDLQVLLEANSTYILDVSLIYTADTASDAKIRWAQSPGGFMQNGYWSAVSIDVSQTTGANVPLTIDAVSIDAAAEIFPGGGAANVLTVLGKGRCLTTTSGTLILQYACNVAGNMAMKTGSYMEVWKVS